MSSAVISLKRNLQRTKGTTKEEKKGQEENEGQEKRKIVSLM
jgi:hypothetical protein